MIFSFSEYLHLHNQGNPDGRVLKPLAAVWARKVSYRTVAFVKLGDTVVDEELIRQGLARVFTRYCDRAIRQEWRVPEAEARRKKRGLWSTPDAIPRWECRRSKRWRQSVRRSPFTGQKQA
jgi:endonuclease YncB( thermonuclease family)